MPEIVLTLVEKLAYAERRRHLSYVKGYRMEARRWGEEVAELLTEVNSSVRCTMLGTANGWATTPDAVKTCRRLGHKTYTWRVSNCLKRVNCYTCEIAYLVDSSG